MDYIDSNIQIINWNEAKGLVKNRNPRLANLISQLDPPKDFDFVHVTYGFGQPIMQYGQLQLPISATETVPLNDSRIPKSIQDRLNYSYVPIALILSRRAEVFYETKERIMPTKVFNQGSMFGLWELFDPPPNEFVKHIWSITAGARSIFMLPKIANQLAHKQLQNEYKIHAYAPNHLLQHHQVFKEIANANDNNSWTMGILFFSKKWQSFSKENETNSLKLYHFLLQEAWRQSSNCRNNMSFDMAWEIFAKAVAKRNMKPKPLIVNTIKHLLSIYDGFYPGYAPAIDDESAPVSIIRQAYEDIYQTNAYPTIMEPVHLSKANRPVYYSLQFPTLLEYAPGTHGKNVITDLRELKILISMLETSLTEQLNRFTFFHSEGDATLEIKNSEEIPALNPSFLPANNKTATFASSSPFLKGCIQVSINSDRATPLIVDTVFQEHYDHSTTKNHDHLHLQNFHSSV